jgi:uncharacterized membrane protein YphA (DoxX/SURF4 family)
MKPFDGAAAAAVGMAAGLIGLGVLSLVFGDFAAVWQPVPHAWPGRPVTPVLSGLLLLAAGAMMLWPRSRAWGAGLAAAFIGLWVLALHLPHAAARPLVWGSWQAVCESLAMATGAFVAMRQAQGQGARPAVYVMGACFIVFGVSHFVYAKFTASMVPAWLPAHMALTWLTGGVHAATGLALLIGVRRRWAALVEAAMMSSFVLLVNVPRAVAMPADHTEVFGAPISIILCAAAWILATSAALSSAYPGEGRDPDREALGRAG